MHFEKERAGRILSLLKERIFQEHTNITDIRFVPGKDPSKPGQPFVSDSLWGGKDVYGWFFAEFEMPCAFDGRRVAVELNASEYQGWDAVNPQFLLSVDEKLVQGIDRNHFTVTIADPAVGGRRHKLTFKAYSGMADKKSHFFLKLAIFNCDIERLYYNLSVIVEAMDIYDIKSGIYAKTAAILTQAVNMMCLTDLNGEAFMASVKRANAYLEDTYYGGLCAEYKSESTAWCVGHTHIDVAWLWRLEQTEEKAERSFATMLNLMDEYPEFVFMSSQPQLYKYVKRNNPELYEKIKKRVAEGRWEAEGAMWLEADCNLASGESLVRQIMHGKRFFKEEFGVDSKALWLPDVFGYSAALPQILKKSGVDYFVTSKISWNEYNRMPYDTFMWKGIDGTEVLTQFLTASDIRKKNDSHFTTYNSLLDAYYIEGGWEKYQQKGINDEFLMTIGYGDGGGGTTRRDLEMGRRLSNGIPHLPRVKFGMAREFLERLDARVADNPRLPKWAGELYLEYHRGTYTSMARNKRYNRKSELMLGNAEWLCAVDTLACGGAYPACELDGYWETVLLNQFHDILPGSSIKWVYDDSREQYEKVLEGTKALFDTAMRDIANRVQTPEGGVVIFNPAGFERSGYIRRHGKRLFAAGLPAKGFMAVPEERLDGANTIHVYDTDTGAVVETPFYKVKFDKSYCFTSIFDKVCNREVLAGRANVFQAFEDLPHAHDAWDINIYYQEKMYEANNVTKVETEDLGGAKAVTVTRMYQKSVIRQRIVFYEHIRRIDFETDIDWKEEHVLLKAAFPVDINADKATYDIQFGNLERPTHWNTPWDKAKFEVCAHKWADLSQDDYGVSILNDCKYGYDIKDSLMRITLLKSATSPNEAADRERHIFTYSLYPHAGTWRTANTPHEAYALNLPMSYIEKEAAETAGEAVPGLLPATFSAVSVDKPNVIIEAVKRAENGEGLIVRVYDCYNRACNVGMTLFKDIARVWETSLLEENITELECRGNKVSFALKPYEIKTLRVLLK